MYFKILKENLIHHGFTYKEGLNVDIKPFDPTPGCKGGLFFADEEHILEFCDYGTQITEVIIPGGEEVVKVNTKYKVHQMMLGKIRDLWTVETFTWLSECGVDLHVENDLALCHAAENGYLEVVEYLTEAGSNIHADNDYALRWAAKNGHIEVTKYLAKQGANIHAANNYALRYAADSGHLEVVKYLVEHNANVHADEDCALRWAVEREHKDVIEYLKRIP